ncbi:hypothetical protein GYA13_03850 [Candidatus Kuenenbacteria bacterium]|nr:hypothetical protein [Candidatus Kuenenbacteria bacterium]
MNNPLLTPELKTQIYNDRNVRTAITRQSHLMFFNIYFASYVTHETARFQKELFSLSEDQNTTMVVVVAFRGSGKSTIMNMSYPLWAILGEQQKKFVIILSQTQRQARQHLVNLRRELESNELLRADLGPFQEQTDEWGSYALVIPRYNAKIMAASTEQSIRGLRHGQYRPDLLICDDVENLDSVKTKENRDKTHDWLVGDVIPAGDQQTRIIIVGNLLHEDSVLMRLKQGITENKINGVYREYPLIDDKGNIAWPGKYPTQAEIEQLKRTTGNETAWQREYLLRIISDVERVIHPDWIQYYDYNEIPPFDDDHDFRFTATGIDLAISQKESADYTAMVSAHVFGYEDKLKIYITPNPINKRMVHKETLDTAMNLSKSLGRGEMTWILVEDVGYQQAVAQELIRAGYPAKAVKVHGSDKRSRLALTSHLIQSGTVLFPKKGTELLISQMTGFGVEKHDDLADAFSLLINKIISLDHKEQTQGIWFLTDDGDWEGTQWRVQKKEFEDD